MRNGISDRDDNKFVNKVANVTKLFASGSSFKDG